MEEDRLTESIHQIQNEIFHLILSSQRLIDSHPTEIIVDESDSVYSIYRASWQNWIESSLRWATKAMFEVGQANIDEDIRLQTILKLIEEPVIQKSERDNLLQVFNLQKNVAIVQTQLFEIWQDLAKVLKNPTQNQFDENRVLRIQPKVCISYDQLDEPLALYLQDTLSTFLPSHEIFLIADPEYLTYGDIWFEVIHQIIEKCSLHLFVITPRSVHSTWFNYQLAGTKFSSDRPHVIVPLLLNVPKESLKATPFTQFQSLSVNDVGGLESVFNEIQMLSLRENELTFDGSEISESLLGIEKGITLPKYSSTNIINTIASLQKTKALISGESQPAISFESLQEIFIANNVLFLELLQELVAADVILFIAEHESASGSIEIGLTQHGWSKYLLQMYLDTAANDS